MYQMQDYEDDDFELDETSEMFGNAIDRARVETFSSIHYFHNNIHQESGKPRVRSPHVRVRFHLVFTLTLSLITKILEMGAGFSWDI